MTQPPADPLVSVPRSLLEEALLWTEVPKAKIGNGPGMTVLTRKKTADKIRKALTQHDGAKDA